MIASIAEFLDIVCLVASNSEDKAALLKSWLNSNMNDKQVELQLKVSRDQEGENVRARECLTVKEMKDKGWSQTLGFVVVLLYLSLVCRLWLFTLHRACHFLQIYLSKRTKKLSLVTGVGYVVPFYNKD